MSPLSSPAMTPALSGAAPVVTPTSGSGVLDLLWLIVALPALGAGVILVLGERRTSRWGHLLGTATVAASFVLGLLAFLAILGRDENQRQVGQHVWTWFEAGAFRADIGLLLDPLSSLFVLLITGVGPSMASSSHDCSGTCADLPQAPSSNSSPITVAMVVPMRSAPALTSTKAEDPKVASISMIASDIPMSPTRLTTKAFLAAVAAVGLCCQKPMSRYDARPTPSQPRNRPR